MRELVRKESHGAHKCYANGMACYAKPRTYAKRMAQTLPALPDEITSTIMRDFKAGLHKRMMLREFRLRIEDERQQINEDPGLRDFVLDVFDDRPQPWPDAHEDELMEYARQMGVFNVLT